MGLFEEMFKSNEQKEKEATEKYEQEIELLTELIDMARAKDTTALAKLLMEIIFLFKYY